MVHEQVRIGARGMTFGALAWGPPDGPLALCLHGYPDSARTWRHLGPYLAERGWRVVAPWTRGYAPTGPAPDDDYWLGTLAADAAALHDALGGDERAVLVGHDWGAATAYALCAHSPTLFRRMVTLAVAPGPALMPRSVRDVPLMGRQLRLSWYMFFQLLPGLSERSLERLIPRLWAAWSPGYDPREDVADVLRGSLPDLAHRRAALRYYRAYFRRAAGRAGRAAAAHAPRTPVLFLYGDRDGCMRPELSARAGDTLRPPSRAVEVPGTGHFLHLERPDLVNPLIGEFLGG